MAYLTYLPTCGLQDLNRQVAKYERFTALEESRERRKDPAREILIAAAMYNRECCWYYKQSPDENEKFHKCCFVVI